MTIQPGLLQTVPSKALSLGRVGQEQSTLFWPCSSCAKQSGRWLSAIWGTSWAFAEASSILGGRLVFPNNCRSWILLIITRSLNTDLSCRNILANYSLKNKSGPRSAFVNKVLLEHSLTHLFTYYCQWLFLPYNSRVEKLHQRLGGQQIL